MSDREEHLPEDLLSFICDAIGAYSPTYHEDAATTLFEHTAQSLGLTTRRDYVDATRYNLVIQASTRPAEIVLVGHLDTIAATENHEPRAVIEDGRLYGLGAVDMKAACALMLYALKLEATGNPAAAVHLVVGEEEYGDGAAVSVARLSGEREAGGGASHSRKDEGGGGASHSRRQDTTGGRAQGREHEGPLVVVGEPSALQPCTEHFSYYEAHLTTRGTRVHAALPELGANAVIAMLDWLSQLNTAISRRSDMVGNPRMIHGGSEEFLVPHICHSQVDIHSHPATGVREIESLLTLASEQEGVARNPEQPRGGESSHGLDFSFRRAFYSEGYALQSDDPRVSPLRTALHHCGGEWSPGAFRSHSDAPIYRAVGFPTVICGPGHLETAHTVDEHIGLADLSAGLALYRALIRTTCREYRR